MRYIRSYDFPDTKDSYLEGVILKEDHELKVYEVMTMKAVLDGESYGNFTLGEHVFSVAMEGCHFIEWEGRIEELDNPEWSGYVSVAKRTHLLRFAA